MFGHFAEDIGITSPDNHYRAAFNTYALEYEIEDAMNEVKALINNSGDTFDTVLELQQFAEDMIPSVSHILTYADYQKLFFEFYH